MVPHGVHCDFSASGKQFVFEGLHRISAFVGCINVMGFQKTGQQISEKNCSGQKGLGCGVKGVVFVCGFEGTKMLHKHVVRSSRASSSTDFLPESCDLALLGALRRFAARWIFGQRRIEAECGAKVMANG